MKVKYSYFLVLMLAFLIGPVLTRGQALTFIKSVPISKPGAVSIDRLGHIYVADQKNILYKFDPTGKQLLTYAPVIQGHLATVEAWNMVRILLFQDERQQITILDRFLTPLATARLSDFNEGIIRTVTLASDERLWLFNESDFTLLKTEIQRPENPLRTPLNLILNQKQYDIRFMREYQNNLYIVDKSSGIYIFDNMGNYRKKLPVLGLSHIGFKGDSLYYIKDNQLILVNLYDLSETPVYFPTDKNYGQALFGDKNVYLFSPTSMDIYQHL